jgi:hypothetical protein
MGAFFGVLQGVNNLASWFFSPRPVAPLRENATPEERQLWLEEAQARTPSRVTRRYLAVITALTWATITMGNWVMGWFVADVPEYVQEASDDVHSPFMLVLGFYFAGGKIREAVEGLVALTKGKK